MSMLDTEDEKKDYFCRQCKGEYTQMEVLDVVDPLTGNFHCRRCDHILDRQSDDFGPSHTGHEVQSRLNAQLGLFEKLLKTIDESIIPDNTFEEAIKNALPVPRDQSINPNAKSEPVPDRKFLPATVRGLATEPEKVQVEMWDEKQRAEADAAAAERRQKIAEQNRLPEWHSSSTVIGAEFGDAAKVHDTQTNGTKVEPQDDKKDLKLVQEDEADKKVAPTIDTDELDQYFAGYGDDAADEDSSEEESSDDDDDSKAGEDESFEHFGDSHASPEGPPFKRVRLDAAGQTVNGANSTNGPSRGDSEESEG